MLGLLRRLQHSREELTSSLKQSIVGLSIDYLGLLAGFIIALNIPLITKVKWALLAYPGILTIRGVTNGILCARLSTSLHLGLINTSFLRNTKYFYCLLASLLVFNFISSVILSCFLTLIGILIIKISAIETFQVVLCIVSSMMLSFSITSPLSFIVASKAYLRSLDPDILVYPIMSTLSDIIISLFYVEILRVTYEKNISSLILVVIIFSILVSTIITRFWRERVLKTTIRESFIALLIVSIIASFTGIALRSIQEIIGAYKPIYLIYPVIIDSIGDIGSIIGSLSTTRLALGTLYARIRDYVGLLPTLIGTWISSLIIFLALPIVPIFMLNYPISNFGKLIRVLLLTNVTSVPIISFISYVIAILAYKKGFDPDNFVNPIESSLADTLASYMLLFSLSLVG